MTVLLVLSAAFAQGAFERHDGCDVPTPVLSSVSVDDVDACERSCTATTGCGAYTFVSGWDRCKLHAPTDRHVAIRMFAAVVTDGVLTSPRAEHDNTGRDLESTPRDLPSAAACGEACSATSGCLGYSYVEGYRSCWLKKTAGVLVEKTFTCGVPTVAHKL